MYGLPTLDLSESAQRQQVVLGGCLNGPESPEYACRACGRELPWTSGAELGIGLT